MALINAKGKYIKLEKDGRYEVYASEESRKRFKESTPSNVILNKYRELIADLEQPEYAEFRYYDPEGFAAIYDPLVQEFYRYCYNLDNRIFGQEYPLMAEFYPDVAGSIPEILEAGQVLISDEVTEKQDTEKTYLEAKRVKRFGETTDA